MAQTSGLTVRQHEREGVELEIEFVVAREHREQVRFSADSAAEGQASIRGLAHDISPGGMGLRVRQYLPRMTEGTVRVFLGGTRGEPEEGAERPVLFEHDVKVRRVYMSSHEPTYDVGVSFVDPAPDVGDRVRAVLARAQSEGGGDA